MVDSLIYQGSRILCKHLFLPLGNKIVIVPTKHCKARFVPEKKKENFFVSQHVC